MCEEPDTADIDEDGYEAPIYLSHQDRQRLQKQLNSNMRNMLDTMYGKQKELS